MRGSIHSVCFIVALAYAGCTSFQGAPSEMEQAISRDAIQAFALHEAAVGGSLTLRASVNDRSFFVTVRAATDTAKFDVNTMYDNVFMITTAPAPVQAEPCQEFSRACPYLGHTSVTSCRHFKKDVLVQLSPNEPHRLISADIYRAEISVRMFGRDRTFVARLQLPEYGPTLLLCHDPIVSRVLEEKGVGQPVDDTTVLDMNGARALTSGMQMPVGAASCQPLKHACGLREDAATVACGYLGQRENQSTKPFELWGIFVLAQNVAAVRATFADNVAHIHCGDSPLSPEVTLTSVVASNLQQTLNADFAPRNSGLTQTRIASTVEQLWPAEQSSNVALEPYREYMRALPKHLSDFTIRLETVGGLVRSARVINDSSACVNPGSIRRSVGQAVALEAMRRFMQSDIPD